MAGSAGGLYLQVKLDTAAAERQLKSLGRAYVQAVNPNGASNAAAKAAVAQARETVAAQKAAAATARQTAAEVTAAGNVEVNRLKAEAVAAKAAAEQSKAAARQRAAEVSATNAATRAEVARAAEVSKTNRVLVSDAVLRRRKQETEATRAQTLALRQAAKEAEALAKKGSAASQLGRIASAGSQDLFVGLGAARSGNVGYGLAAVTRYAQSLTAAARGASVALVGVAGAVVTIGAVAVTAGVAIAALAKSLLEAGTQGAESFELLRIQLGALLGSAKAGQDEFDFLINLGKTSIIPTESLIQADRTLLSFGVTAQSTRRELVTLFANIGSAFSLTTDQIYFLSLAISQVVAKGKADAVDLRQLANNGIATTKLYESIAKATGKTVKEIAAEQENGGLSAQQILVGLTGLTKEYQGAADAAAKSAGGLKQNLQDTFSAGLSNAFLKGGALEPIKAFFASLLDVVGNTKGLFDNLAASARNLFDAALGGDVAKTSGNFIVSLFRDYIPSAVNAFASVVRAVRPFIMAFVENVRAGLTTLNDAFRAAFGNGANLGTVLGALAASSFIVVNSLIAIGVISTSVFSAVISGAQAAAAAMVGNFSGAYEYLKQGATSIVSAYLRVQGIINATRSAFKPQAGPGPVKGDDSNLGNGPGKGSDAGAGAAAASGAAQKASAAAQKIATARNELYDLLKTYFGRPSDALAGLFGDQGKFTATTDSIVANAKRIYDAILAAAPGARGRGIADFVEEQTEKLLKLAKRRDQVTKALEEANNKLKAIIEERDSFIKQIRDSAQSFVFDLNVGSATTSRDISGDGYAGTSSVTGSGSFAEQVKKRLADYKAFVANIRKLAKSGLDKQIIKEFLQAGPSAAGAVVAQLAGAGAGVIGDLNAAQAELNKVAKEFGVEQGGVYYQAGVDTAQKTVDGLESQLSTIEKAARKISNSILKAIKPLAKKMRDAGTAAGGGLATGLGDAFKATPIDFGDPLGDLFPDDSKINTQSRDFVDNLFDNLKNAIEQTSFYQLGASILSRITGGVVSAMATAYTAGSQIASNIVGGFISFWTEEGSGKIGMALGGIVNLLPGPKALLGALRGLFNGDVKGFFTSLPSKLGIDKLWNSLTATIPSPKGVLDKIKGVLNPVATWLESKSFNPWRLLLDGIPSVRDLTNRLSVLKTAFIAVLNGVIAAWNKLDIGIDVAIPDWVPVFGGKGFKISDIFPDADPIKLAAGGIATAPTLAVVGDNKRRPEAVVPLTAQGIATFMEGVGGGGDVAVEARVFIGDRELTDIVRTEVRVIDRSTAISVAGNRRL